MSKNKAYCRKYYLHQRLGIIAKEKHEERGEAKDSEVQILLIKINTKYLLNNNASFGQASSEYFLCMVNRYASCTGTNQ